MRAFLIATIIAGALLYAEEPVAVKPPAPPEEPKAQPNIVNGVEVKAEAPRQTRAKRKVEAPIEKEVEKETELLLRVPIQVDAVGTFPPSGMTKRGGPLVVCDGEVVSVSDSENVLVKLSELDVSKVDHGGRPQTSEQLVWIRGFNTKKLVDGSAINLRNLGKLKATGSQSYRNSLGGKKTVILLEPMKE